VKIFVSHDSAGNILSVAVPGEPPVGEIRLVPNENELVAEVDVDVDDMQGAQGERAARAAVGSDEGTGDKAFEWSARIADEYSVDTGSGRLVRRVTG